MHQPALFTFFGLSLTAALAAQSSPRSAVIVNSGSTNMPGFKIVVERGGKAEYVPTLRAHPQPETPPPASKKNRLPPALSKRFFADLEAARPFSDLPRPTCMKSVSLGSRETIQFNGDETPDLDCGSGHNEKLGALIQDSRQIVAVFSAR